jgi:long-chain fatty acid transport protein
MQTPIKFLSAAVSLLLAARAGAAGFALDVLDARAMSLAAAVTASIDDAAAAFYNPAGLARGKGKGLGLDAKVGTTMIIPAFTVTPAGEGTTTVRKVLVFVPSLYASYGITDKVTAGLGLFTPYGLKLNWPAGWPGSRISTSSSLETFYINPEVAVRLWDNRLRIGAGVQVVRATVELTRDIQIIPGTLAALDVGASGWGVGGNGGVQLDLTKFLTIGAAYRSPVYVPFDGDAHFSNVPLELSQTLRDQSASAAFTLPQIFNAGVAVRPVQGLTVDFDVWYYGWQSFHDLHLHFENPRLNTREVKSWHHAWNYHLGAEYQLPSGLAFRGGVLIDPTPSPADTLSPVVPDSNRVNLGAGVGYQTEHYGVDLGYQAVIFQGKDSAGISTTPPFPASYGGHAQLISLSLRYRR